MITFHYISFQAVDETRQLLIVGILSCGFDPIFVVVFSCKEVKEYLGLLRERGALLFCRLFTCGFRGGECGSLHRVWLLGF